MKVTYDEETDTLTIAAKACGHRHSTPRNTWPGLNSREGAINADASRAAAL